jgi:hypothetical protein
MGEARTGQWRWLLAVAIAGAVATGVSMPRRVPAGDSARPVVRGDSAWVVRRDSAWVVRRDAAWVVRRDPAWVVTGDSGALRSCPTPVRRLGLIAFVARGRLELVDLARCRVSVLRAIGATEPRFSPDGRWLVYGQLGPGGPAIPVVIPAHGGAARPQLGPGIVAWAWGPTGAVLYGITRRGSLVAATPDGRRRIVANGVGPTYYTRDNRPFAVSPDGEMVALDRSRCEEFPGVGELDTVNLRTGARTVVLRKTSAIFTLAGWSPDDRWLLFWTQSQCSGSLAADGGRLEAVPAAGGSPVTVVRHMLFYDDFLSWCGSELVAAAGPDRETETGGTLVETAPPAWRARTLRPLRPADRFSWVSPSCAPGGRLLAAAVGPNDAPVRFGLQDRSIWLLRPGGRAVRRLTLPPARGLSDEAPRFSRDGRWVLFVRSRVTLPDSSRDTIELVRATTAVGASGAGDAIPIVDFTTDDFSYYDHFSWPFEIDWSSPR